MRSQTKRVQRLESKTMQEREDVPNSLQGIYEREDNPESDMHKAMEALYNPNRKIRNPNEAI